MSRFHPNSDGNQDDNPVYENILTTKTETKLTSTIEIRGFDPNTHIDTIILYFENSKRSGGDDVSGYTQISDVIYITFESEEIAKRVCNRRHTVDNVTLCVRQCEKLQIPEASGEQGTEKVTLQSLIEQRGHNPTPEKLETGRTEPTAPSNEEKINNIDPIYEDINDVDSLNLPSFNCFEQICSVFEDKVLIENLNPETTQECLFNFLCAKTDATPLQIVYSWEETSAVVSFSEKLDFIEKLEHACKTRTLENHYLKVSRVPKNYCVMIKNTDETTTSDTVRYYFENKRRSGGGEITSIEYNEDEGGWLVYFKEFEAMKNVCQKNHKIEDNEITVSIFYPCLGIPQFKSKLEIKQAKLTIKIPDPYHVEEKHKVEFIKKDEALKQTFENDLEKLHAKIQWPATPEERLTVYCTMTADNPRCRLLVKQWLGKIETTIQSYLDKLAKDTFAVDKEAWAIVKKNDELKLFENFEKNKLLFVENEDEIIIVCSKNKMGLVKKIRLMVQEAQKIRHRVLNERKKPIRLQPHQIQLLLLSGFAETISEKFKDLDVKLEIDSDNLQVTVIGLENDIQTVLLHLYETKENIRSLNVGKISKEKSEFLQSQKVKKYLLEEMMNANLVAWFDINETFELVLYTISTLSQVNDSVNEYLQRSADLIKSLVLKVTVSINSLSSPLLSSQKWYDEKKDVEDIAPGLVVITENIDSGNITLLTVKHYAPFCREKIEKFFKSNTIHEKKIDASATEVDIAKKYKREEIETRMSRAQVQILYEANAIKIRGTCDGISQAEHILKINLLCAKKTYRRAVFIKYLKSAGTRLFGSIESAKRCVIKLNIDPILQKESSVDIYTNESLERLSCVLPSGQKIVVLEGAIWKLEVDVMVCAVNKDLKLIGGLGKAIADRGGPAIQNKCDIYIKRNGSLKEGQLYVSSEGAENLMCKHIVFVVGPMYTGKRISEEENILKELILKSLKECEKRNLHSVVFPAICTGYNRFPVAEATRVIALAIQNYFQNNLRSCIKKVYLCDTDKQKVESFELAMQSVFGVANCMREQRSNQEHKVKRGNSSTTLQSRMHHSSYETWRGDRDCRGKMGDFVNVTVGKLDLKVFHGDITCAKADVVVISARPDMDLSKGFLSNKVKQKGGDVIQQELNSQRSLMKSEGMVVTTSGKLPCKYLVHIDISGTELPEHWKTKFINLLKKTEELEMQSVAIPALGMRDEEGIGIVAKELFQALTEHKNPKFLQEVHMVFYEADMKHNFLEEIQERIRLKDNPAKRLFRQFSCRLLVPFSNEHRSPVPDETLTITVDSETDKSNTEAIRMIDAEIKKNLATTLIENNIVKELSPLQQKSILSIPEYICVEVTLNIKSGKIILLGCEEDVKKAQEDVEMVIRQAERYKKDFEKFVPKQYKK